MNLLGTISFEHTVLRGVNIFIGIWNIAQNLNIYEYIGNTVCSKLIVPKRFI